MTQNKKINLDKEIKEWLESFSKEEWIKKLDEEKKIVLKNLKESEKSNNGR